APSTSLVFTHPSALARAIHSRWTGRKLAGTISAGRTNPTPRTKAQSRGAESRATAGHSPMAAKIPPTRSPKLRSSVLAGLVELKFLPPVRVLGQRLLARLLEHEVL